MDGNDWVQATLDQPEWFAPVLHGSAHYVAVVQNKSGELDALKHASPGTWDHMTPLIEIVGPRKVPEAYSGDTVAGWVKRVADAVEDRPCFLDTLRLRSRHPTSTRDGEKPALAVIHAAARKRRVACVPVLRLADSQAQVTLIRDAVLRDGRGVALRYPLLTAALPEGHTLESAVKAALGSVEVETTGADLLIDLGYLPPEQDVCAEDIARSVDQFTGVGEWRSVVLLGTSMPSMLGGVIAEGTMGEIPRREWELWAALKLTRPQRLPAFGDYMVQHPHPPQEGGGPSMRANVRYTTESMTLVVRGQGPIFVAGKEQYRTLCQMLVEHPQFAGRDYSWGDAQIADCASGVLEPGSNNAWRGAGSSHHLRRVTDQLRN